MGRVHLFTRWQRAVELQEPKSQRRVTSGSRGINLDAHGCKLLFGSTIFVTLIDYHIKIPGQVFGRFYMYKKLDDTVLAYVPEIRPLSLNPVEVCL